MRRFCTFLILFLTCFFCSVSFADENPLKKLYGLGVLAYEQGHCKSAISIFEKALDLYPKFAPSYNYLGLCHKEMGDDLKDVSWFFEQAIMYNPKYVYPYDNLCKVDFQMGEYTKAEEMCLKALELKPDLYTAKLSLAWIYLLGQSKPDDAIPYFEEVLDVAKSPVAQFGLGIAYFMNDEKYKMFDIITALRKTKNEKLAVQLENIMRSNKFAEDLKEGMPLLLPPRQPAIMPDEFPDIEEFESDKKSDVAGMKVRLRGKGQMLSNKEPVPIDRSIPEDRIKRLQENSQNIPQVKYYY